MRLTDLLDSLLKRFGVAIVSVVLAVLFVLLARPFPLEKPRELSTWWYILGVILVVSLTIGFYRYIRRGMSEKKREEVIEAGE